MDGQLWISDLIQICLNLDLDQEGLVASRRYKCLHDLKTFVSGLSCVVLYYSQFLISHRESQCGLRTMLCDLSMTQIQIPNDRRQQIAEANKTSIFIATIQQQKGTLGPNLHFRSVKEYTPASYAPLNVKQHFKATFFMFILGN